MKADLIDHPKLCEAQDCLTSSGMPARLRDLWERFPLASKSLLSVFDQAIVSGTSFVTAVIIGRATSPDQLGLYYLTLSIVLVALGIQEQLVAAPYTVYSKRRHGTELALYAGSAWLHHFALTAVSIVVLLAVIAALSLAGSADIVPGLWALVGAGPLLLLREGIRRFAFANLQLVSAIAVDASVALAQLSGLLLLAHFDRLSVFTIYAMMGGACAIASLGWYLLNPPVARLQHRRFFPDWWHNWSFSKWALRSYLVGNTTFYIMPWILNLAVGTAATGVLGACGTLVGVTNILLAGVANVLTPQAAHAFAVGGRADLSRLLRRTAAILALVLGSFCVLLLVTGDRLAVFVYGNQFQGCGAILTTLALSVLMTALGMTTGTGLWAIEQPRSNFLADVCWIVVTLVSAVFLVFPFGALGAALATLAGTFVAAIVRTVILVRALDPTRLEAHAS
ncbi:MAG: lipopolysaccharide biosynthesis protein [Planctomycetia bacterium]|nr:lipopolysaccharide biosynthesis protein [Planctomycetia bacterium]